jgi:acid phosphatase
VERNFPLKKLLVALWILVGLVPASLHAQQSVATEHQPSAKVAALAPGERLLNLDKLKDELKQYHDCARECYTKDLDLQGDRAIAFLRHRAAHRRPDEKLALVLDIDETTLSNYQRMVKAGFAWDKDANDVWVESAQAPAIPGTLRLFKEAQRLGVSVLFLTGRPESQRAATERNLRSQGFDNWEELILRQPAQQNLSALKYKSAVRAEKVAQGYRIVLNVGDQWSDLRSDPVAEYSVKYPDPYYFLR